MRQKERYFLASGKLEEALKTLNREYQEAAEKRPGFLKDVGGNRLVGDPDIWGVVFEDIPKGNDWVKAENHPEAFRPNPDTPNGRKWQDKMNELNGPDEEEAARRVGAHAVFVDDQNGVSKPVYPEFAILKNRIVVICPVGNDGSCFEPEESREISRDDYQILKKAAGKMDPADPDDLVDALTRLPSNDRPPPQNRPPTPGG